MRFWNIIIRFTIVLFTIFICSESFAQKKLSEGEQEVENKANAFFEDENYAEALHLFSRLLSTHPKDPDYNYAYGVCLIEENKDLDKALTFLNFTLKNIEKPSAIYYIGKVWHMKYKFDDAIKFYTQFKEKAKKEDLKKFPVDRQIKMCSSGKDLIRYVSILNVEVNKVVKSKDFYYSYEIDDFGGKILIKPEEYKTKIDKKREKNSENKTLMFLSTEQNVVYYSSYGENDKNGKDIYRRVKDNATGQWLPPENLGSVINTTYDEDFPYIHPDGQTLYFASKGHNSMGGYDIFKSTYDWTKNTWSEPINLDFPTNSPYDDYLYISDSKENTAYFASNRETGQTNISVYRIKIDKNPQIKEVENFDELIKKSKLEVTTSTSIAMDTRDENIKLQQNNDKNTTNTSNTFEKGKFTFSELSFTENMTSDEIFKEADNDAAVLEKEAAAAANDANIVLLISDKKNLAANEKRKEADNSKISNDIVKEDADRLAKEAVLAYNLAINLKNISEDKKKDAKDARDFAKELAFNKNSKPKELVDAVNASRQKITNQQKNYTTVEKELFKSKISINETNQFLSNKNSDQEAVKNTVADLETKIKDSEEKLPKEINTATKIKLENQIKDWENEISGKKRQELQLNFEIKQLEIKLKNANNDIAFYQDVLNEINSNKAEYAEAEKKVATIDNIKLTKDIKDKKEFVEKQLAEINLVENKKIESDKNLLVGNENYNQIISEAKSSERIADSLTLVIESDKKNLIKIKDKKKKDAEQNRINNLVTIAEFKKQDAEKKYAQANELGKTYISLNDVSAELKKKETEAETKNKSNITSDNTQDNKQQTIDNNQQLADNKQQTTTTEQQTNNLSSGVTMKSVLPEKDQKKLREENPNYNKLLNEGTKALHLSDSLLRIASEKKKNLDKIKNAQEKQAEQENIANMENIASFKKQLAEKRFADINQQEKAYLISQGKSTEVFASTQTTTEQSDNKQQSTDNNKQVTDNNQQTNNKKLIPENKEQSINKEADKKIASSQEIEDAKKIVLSSTITKKEQKELSNSNTVYKNILSDAYRSQDVADSLFSLAEAKKTGLVKIKDKNKRQSEQEVISNIENIALFKKQHATKKFAQLKEIEQEFTTAKNLASKENKTEKSNESKNNISNNNIIKSKQQFIDIEKDPVKKEIFTKDSAYNVEVKSAKEHEARIDSLNSFVAEKRKKLEGTESKKELKEQEELLTALENRIIDEQKEADMNYTRAIHISEKLISQKEEKDQKKKVSVETKNNENTIAENKKTVPVDTVKNVITENTIVAELSKSDKAKLSKNEKYKKLTKEVEKNNSVADSLIKIIEAKKKNLNKIKNVQDKQAELDQITNIESIAKFKKEYADKKQKEANEYGISYIAENPNLKEEKSDVIVETKTETKETKTEKKTVTEEKNTENKNQLVETKVEKKKGKQTIADNKTQQVTKNNDKKQQPENKTEKKDIIADNKTTENIEKKKGKQTIVDNKKQQTTKNNNKKDDKKLLAENKTKIKSEENKSETKNTNIQVKEQNKQIEQSKKELLKNDEYNNLISEGKKAETQADSLSYIAKERKNKLNSITDPALRKEEESSIAELEKTSEFKRQYAEQKYSKANNLSKDVLAEKSNSGVTNQNTGILKATVEEQDKYYRENTANYKIIETEATNSFTDANSKFEKFNTTNDSTDKLQIKKELIESIYKIKTKLLEAYKLKSNADIVKNTMLENRVTQMLSLPEIKNNKQIAERYKKDADQYSAMAENSRTHAVNTTNSAERLKELKKALTYEQLAIQSNETALDVLMETKPVDFVAVNDLVKPDDNDPYLKLQKIEDELKQIKIIEIAAYDKQTVKQEVQAKLYANKDNKAIIDKINNSRQSNESELKEIKDIEETISGLKQSIENSSNPKDKKDAEDKIMALTKKINKKKYGIASSLKKEHEQLYDLYIKNVFALRPTETSLPLTEGMSIESKASENFKKADEFRTNAALEKDNANAIPLLDKANEYELLAIEQQEKAFGMYLKIIAVTTKIEESKDVAENINISNDMALNNMIVKVEKKDLLALNETEIKTDNKKENKTEIKETKKKEIKTEKKQENISENKTEVKEAKVEKKKDTEKKNKIEIVTDNIKKENKLAVVDNANTNYGFNVTQKNTAEASKEIPMNEAIPSGIVYRVQVGAFKVPIQASVFKGLNPLACEKLANSQFSKYLVGLFKSEEAAKVAREEVRRIGYSDAFIVAYKDGVRIPLYAARNSLKGEDGQKYSEMAKNEVETLNKNIKDAKNINTANNIIVENKNQNTNTTVENKETEKKKKGKKTIDEFKKEKEDQKNNKQLVENTNKQTINKTEIKMNEQNSVNSFNVKDVKGLLYTVQIGVFRNARTSGDLMNLSPIFEEKINLGGNEAVKYTTGLFADYIEAIAAKEKIVKLGIKDAYVVVYYNGKTIPVNQANIMVMNQGSSVITNPKDLNINLNSNADQVKTAKDKEKGKPATVTYKVQIGAFKDQVPNDILDLYIKVAANGGLSNFIEGEMKVYTIGEYKNYDEATKMKNKLVEQGIKDAFVIAFKGTEKISIESAKEIQKNK